MRKYVTGIANRSPKRRLREVHGHFLENIGEPTKDGSTRLKIRPKYYAYFIKFCAERGAGVAGVETLCRSQISLHRRERCSLAQGLPK